MKITLTAAQAKEMDRYTIEEVGIPSLVLMERAALALADEAEKLVPAGAKILAVCGMGNNGADGIAAARILTGRGRSAQVLLFGRLSSATKENDRQRSIAEKSGVKIWLPQERDAALAESAGLLIDALFGVGLTRLVEGEAAQLLDRLAAKAVADGAKILAADMPSGISSDTGAVMGTALRADVTVTFGFRKSGLLLYPGRTFAGRLICADIGFSDHSLEHSGFDARVFETPDCAAFLKRRADANKGSFGKVLVLAGCAGMAGAAYLCALGAYRMGAGLVKVLTVPENRPVLHTLLPEALVRVYDPDLIADETQETAPSREKPLLLLNEYLTPARNSDADEEEKDPPLKFLEEECRWADAIVVGPGLGQAPYVRTLVEDILANTYVPVVLDADGLNCVAAFPALARYFTENIVVTPHIGEMARLTGLTAAELKADRLAAARDYSAQYGAVCVLKDACTVTADKDGNAWINESGSSALAKGGSGDVLAGAIGALLARGADCPEAAAAGVFMHGLAGEKAAALHGKNPVLARETADCLPAAEDAL